MNESENKYSVTGYCLIPVKVRIEVYAKDEASAMAAAKKQWDESSHKRIHIVSGTEDESSACDFQPNEAERLIQ